MMETLLFVVMFFVGYMVGWRFRELHAIKNMNDMMENANAVIEETAKENTIEVFIEVHDGELFVYNKSTSEYMAHAKTKKLLEEMLMKKFPGKTFNASHEDVRKIHSHESI